jgi:putative MATE family efflux protein
MITIFKNLFNDSKFYRNLIKIALPIVIQNFIASSLNMVDTMMIGKVGEAEIAAVGIANQLFFLFVLITAGVCSGGGVLIAQFWGKKDTKNIRRVLGIGITTCVIIALMFTVSALLFPRSIMAIFNKDLKVIELGAKYLRIVCFSYIFTAINFNYAFSSRCIERTVMPMVVSAIALGCNTFLNYVFIFGNFGAPNMGVEGAALATLIARVIETVLLVGYIYGTNGVLAAKISEMIDLNRVFINRVFKTSLPVILNEACWGLAAVVYSAIYGRIGTQAIASIQICSTIQNLFMVIIFGMASSAAVMIGNKVGAGEEDTAKVYGKRFCLLGVIIGTILAISLAAAATFILSFFNVSEKVVHDSLMILYIVSGILVVRVLDILLIVGILRGGGDVKFSFLIETFTMWCIGVPLALIGAFVLKLPVYYVVALVTMEEIVKLILSLWRFLSNKWVRNIVHNM